MDDPRSPPPAEDAPPVSARAVETPARPPGEDTWWRAVGEMRGYASRIERAAEEIAFHAQRRDEERAISTLRGASSAPSLPAILAATPAVSLVPDDATKESLRVLAQAARAQPPWWVREALGVAKAVLLIVAFALLERFVHGH